MVDVDYSYVRAVRMGATGVRPPEDQSHGNRNAVIVDPYGHRWMLSQPSRGQTFEELQSENPGYTITNLKPVEVGYLTMHTNDIERAAAFYSKVLDWQVDPAGGHVGNTKLPMGFETDYNPGGGTRLWFRVPDLEPYLARVRENGGEVIEVAEHPSGGSAECRDDQGIRFDLHRPAPGD